MPKTSRTPLRNSRMPPSCAGIAGAPGQKTGNIDYESWVQVLDVNTLGPSRVLESFSNHVARSEQKLVVTITSGMGSHPLGSALIAAASAPTNPPKGVVLTGLCQQSNLSPQYRNGNWKKASRDGRPKHAPKGLK
jgi:NAD(P)-dependent dehydrogenase (short-subunit alcohol dehydrogenase family)